MTGRQSRVQPSAAPNTALLFEIVVLFASLDQNRDRDIRVGVFPQHEKILVGGLCLGLISRQGERSSDLQVRQSADGIADHDVAAIYDLLKFRSGLGP